MFRLTEAEWAHLRSQFATSKNGLYVKIYG
jgi:hypothetical protein